MDSGKDLDSSWFDWTSDESLDKLSIGSLEFELGVLWRCGLFPI